MERVDLQSMSLAELWSVREHVQLILVEKLETELQTLKSRLSKISGLSGRAPRRPPKRGQCAGHQTIEPDPVADRRVE